MKKEIYNKEKDKLFLDESVIKYIFLKYDRTARISIVLLQRITILKNFSLVLCRPSDFDELGEIMDMQQVYFIILLECLQKKVYNLNNWPWLIEDRDIKDDKGQLMTHSEFQN
ncbi:hypothetical protein pb186bvf_006169 [Paramecium bursaria]